MSPGTSYDIARNQILRNIDVMLESGADHQNLMEPLASRDPDRSCFVLVTPDHFYRDRKLRFYGLIFDLYRSDPTAMDSVFDRSDRRGQAEGASARMGWLTFEMCRKIDPRACAWLGQSNAALAGILGDGEEPGADG